MKPTGIFLRLPALLLLALFAVACQDGERKRTPQTGAITAQLVWPEDTRFKALREGTDSFRWIVPAGVTSIRGYVTANDITTPPETIIQVNAGDSGTGTITDVPVGENRTLTVEGRDGADAIIYSGSTTGITVAAGSTADAGEVTMTLFTPPGDVTNLTVTTGDSQISLNWTNPGDSNFTGVRVCWSDTSPPTEPLVRGANSTDVSKPGVGTTVTGLINDTLYYFTAFSYNGTPNYSSGVNASATPNTGGGGSTLSNPTLVSAGSLHTCALDDSGVVCWGDNQFGQTTVPSLTNPSQISGGIFHTCALDDTGVVCWGRNADGQTTVPTLSNPNPDISPIRRRNPV